MKKNESIAQGEVRALFANSTDVLIGGSFDSKGTSTKINFADLSVSNAALKTIDSSPDNYVYAISLFNSQIVIGGSFTFLNKCNVVKNIW